MSQQSRCQNDACEDSSSSTGGKWMNERSPVGQGRSLTGPSPAGHSGQTTRATATHLPVGSRLDSDIDIGGALAQIGDAIEMSIQGEIVGQSLSDRESIGEQDRSQLNLNLAPGHGPNLPVTGADIATKPDLHGPIRLGPYTSVPLTVAGWEELAESFGERFLVVLDSSRQLALVHTIGEVEGEGIVFQTPPVPDAHSFEIVELRTARSMFLKARETNRVGERDAQPVEGD